MHSWIFLIQHLEVSSSSHLTRLGQPESLGTVNVRVHGSTCSELAGIRFESLDRLVCLTIVAFSKPSNTLATLHDQGANLYLCATRLLLCMHKGTFHLKQLGTKYLMIILFRYQALTTPTPRTKQATSIEAHESASKLATDHADNKLAAMNDAIATQVAAAASDRLTLKQQMDALSAALHTQREEAAGAAAAAAAIAAAALEAAPATAAHEAAVAALGVSIAAVGGEVEALHLEVAGLKEMAVEQGREIGTLMADGNGVAQSLQQQVSSGAKFWILVLGV